MRSRGIAASAGRPRSVASRPRRSAMRSAISEAGWASGCSTARRAASRRPMPARCCWRNCRPAFGDIGSAFDALNQFRETPFGKVRINAPNSIAPFVLGPVMAPLIGENPNLELEIVATDRLVDIVEEGFDAGIRLGESLRDGMTAVKIKPRLRFAVVGSPAYFAQPEIPQTPATSGTMSASRTCIRAARAIPGSSSAAARLSTSIRRGPIALDDHELMVEAALSGVGAGLCLGEPRPARNPRRQADSLPRRLVSRRRTGFISTIRAAETSQPDCARSSMR